MKKTLTFILCLCTLLVLLCSCKEIEDITGGLIGGGGSSDTEKPCEHNVVVDAAVEATCTSTGLTEGSHCSLCGEVLKKQEDVAMLQHNSVVDEAVEKTCTTDGLTAGTHCSVCKTVIIKQEVVPASHEYGEGEKLTDPDCFFGGETRKVCTVCEEEDIIVGEPLEHSFAKNEESGLQECEACGAVIYAGHLYATFEAHTNWYDAYKICEEIGGHLATITSEYEQAFLTDLISMKDLTPFLHPAGEFYYFIGGIKSSSGWEWVTDEDFSYTHWGPQLEGGIQWYVGLTTKHVHSGNNKMQVGDWEDLNHGDARGYICEWELDLDCTEHSFTEWETVKEVSCFGDGEEYRFCTYCGAEETKVLEQLEHNFVFKEETGLDACELCGAARYDGRIYKLFEDNISWFDAQAYCESVGAHLVTITSAEEQTFVETYMKSQDFTEHTWIGAYTDGAKWRWVTEEIFDYTNWEIGQPKNDQGKEYFAHLNQPGHFGEWNDCSPIEDRMTFICEWEAS